jgi:hypothetical protein
MCSRTGLHANQAGRRRREKLQHLTAAKLFPEDDLLGRIDAVDLKHKAAGSASAAMPADVVVSPVSIINSGGSDPSNRSRSCLDTPATGNLIDIALRTRPGISSAGDPSARASAVGHCRPRRARGDVLEQIGALHDCLVPLGLELRVMGAPTVHRAERHRAQRVERYGRPALAKPSAIRRKSPGSLYGSTRARCISEKSGFTLSSSDHVLRASSRRPR